MAVDVVVGVVVVEVVVALVVVVKVVLTGKEVDAEVVVGLSSGQTHGGLEHVHGSSSPVHFSAAFPLQKKYSVKSSYVASVSDTPVIWSNLPKFFEDFLLKFLIIVFPHLFGMKPQLDPVVEIAVLVVEVVDDDVVVVNSVVLVVIGPGGEPHPTRLAETRISSNSPPMVVAAPPKLSTPKPIQSRFSGRDRPVGTFDPIPEGESQVTAAPDTKKSNVCAVGSMCHS